MLSALCLPPPPLTPWPQEEERFHDLDSLSAEDRNQIECAAALGLIPDDGTGLFHPDSL